MELKQLTVQLSKLPHGYNRSSCSWVILRTLLFIHRSFLAHSQPGWWGILHCPSFPALRLPVEMRKEGGEGIKEESGNYFAWLPEFLPIWGKGHPAGPSTLFLTDIKVGTKYYSFLTVITGAWREIGGRMWRTQGSWHGSTQSVQILSGPEVGYTDPKSSTVGTLSWDEKREVGKCQSWVILSKKRLVIANAISHLLF